jgi:hypothetical protein
MISPHLWPWPVKCCSGELPCWCWSPTPPSVPDCLHFARLLPDISAERLLAVSRGSPAEGCCFLVLPSDERGRWRTASYERPEMAKTSKSFSSQSVLSRWRRTPPPGTNQTRVVYVIERVSLPQRFPPKKTWRHPSSAVALAQSHSNPTRTAQQYGRPSITRGVQVISTIVAAVLNNRQPSFFLPSF